MSAEFVACMEDVLDLYAEPYDPERPVVCFDETSKQLLAEKRSPIPPKPARRERYDYEYQRNGTRNLFMLCEPLAGWRHVAVTERRTMVDFAKQMRWLADEAYPASEKIRVVLDNLNTHKPASLYETFGGYVNRCVNDIRRRPSQPLIQWRFHPHTVHRDRRLRSTQGPSDA